jgi:hypothetical protein
MKDIGKAFSFVFRDPRWVSKVAMAALFMVLSIFLVGIFILAGYFIQLTQRVMRKEEYPLPEWNDVGVMFVTGFKFAIAYLIYLLPVMILMVPLIVVVIATAFAGEPDVLGAFMTVYLFGFTLIIVPYALALNLFFPIIAYKFAREEKISDALDVGGIFRDFRANWENTLIVALIAAGIQSFAAIGIFMFLIGIFVTIFYAYAVSAYLSGALGVSVAEKGVNGGAVVA